jgi:hypothetical protein
MAKKEKMKKIILKKDLNGNIKKAFENKKLSKKEEIEKKKKEKKVEIRVIKERKKIKVVRGDENLAKSWLVQSENNFRERLTRLSDQQVAKRLENVAPTMVEVPIQGKSSNLPPERNSRDKNAEDEFKYSTSHPDNAEKKYFTEKSPTFYSSQAFDITTVGREKNEFRQAAFERKAGVESRSIRFDNYVAPSGVDTASLGRKDPLKKDELMYRTKLPS